MNVEPLRWEDGALLVLDQRALPGSETWIRCESHAQVGDCIRSLAVRGAPAIGIAAAYAMGLAARRGEDLGAAAAMLRATRPDIPVLFLDTVHHFAETHAYRDRLADEWGLNLITLRAA